MPWVQILITLEYCNNQEDNLLLISPASDTCYGQPLLKVRSTDITTALTVWFFALFCFVFSISLSCSICIALAFLGIQNLLYISHIYFFKSCFLLDIFIHPHSRNSGHFYFPLYTLSTFPHQDFVHMVFSWRALRCNLSHIHPHTSQMLIFCSSCSKAILLQSIHTLNFIISSAQP